MRPSLSPLRYQEVCKRWPQIPQMLFWSPAQATAETLLRNRSRAGGCVSSHGIGSLQLTKRKETEAGLQGWVFGQSEKCPDITAFWKIILQGQGCHKSLGYLKDAPIVLDKREDAAWGYSRSLHLAWGCDQVEGPSLFCLLRWGLSLWLTNRSHIGSFYSSTLSRVSMHSYGVKAQTITFAWVCS